MTTYVLDKGKVLLQLLAYIFLAFFFFQMIASSSQVYADYCCRFQCCDGTWLKYNCTTSYYPWYDYCAGIDFANKCYYHDGYGNCPSPCTSGCNACAGYSYLQSSYTNRGTKSVSCIDDCGDRDWDTCYCKYTCSPTSCPSGTSESGTYGFYRTYSCNNDCNKTYSRNCYCSSTCTPTSCPTGTSESGTYGLYDTYNCTNACGQGNSRSCYCTSSCTPASCPAGTSESGTHGLYQTYSCTNSCGTGNSRSCYCNTSCTPPSCPTGTSETAQGEEYTAQPVSCSNDCEETQTRTCYCNTATCSDLQSEVEWLDECPDNSCRSVERNVPIPNAAQSCPTEQSRVCYINNDKPQTADIENPQNGLEVSIQTDDEILNYSSNTHTGTQLNNPLRVTAQFRDINGIDDLQALYIWWSTSATKNFTTPNQLGGPLLGAKTENNENFGFMVTRHQDGNWDNLYRPYIDGETKRWVQPTTTSPTSISILGPNEEEMVNVFGVNVVNSGDNELTLEFSLEFLLGGANNEKVANSTYNIWALANDTTGFLPFEKDEVIQDSQDIYWKDSGTNWVIDLERPIITSPLTTSHITETHIAMRFAVEDRESNLSRVRLDACRTVNGDNHLPLLVGEREYMLVDCDTVNWGTHNPTDINMNSGSNLLGLDPIDPDAPQYSISDPPLVINLNGNENGSVTFYLTVMDEAGNWNQSLDILRLGEWVAVKGAFLFGSRGVSSSTRVLETDWDSNPLIKSDYGFEYDSIDLTDQVLIGGRGSLSSFLGVLERYLPEENNSFKVSQFYGVFINSPYRELMETYRNRTEQGAISNYAEVSLSSPTLSGNILDHTACNGNTYCILTREGDLEIESGSECVGNGLVAVGGNLIINPDFKNLGDRDRCIFLVSGNVNIKGGDDPGVNSKVDYDVVEGFVIAGGQIVIEYDSSLNGLIVEGGLAGFNSDDQSTAIHNLRTIDIDFRNKYPVLAVRGNSKYGLLAKSLFGSQADLFRIDIGFKPY